MKKESKESRNGKYFAVYSICFLVIGTVIFSALWRDGKSFIFKTDGLQQHFNALLYYRTWMRSIVHNLWVEHNFEIPLWDMSIGYGADIITTLHYYVIGDPLNLLAIFVPKESYMETFYCFLIILRIYLAGLAFSAYAFTRGCKRYPALLGTLIYIFSYWTIIAIRHPYFINPLIYLPLILIGVDRILEKRKPVVYMLTLAMSVISSFYFSYMICIFIVLYTVVRYIGIHKKIKCKEMFYWIFYMVRYSITALAISAFMLLPVVYATLSAGRAKVQNRIPMLYSMSYYKHFVKGFLYGGTKYWCNMGYTLIGVIAVLMLFSKRKKYTELKAGFIIMTLMLCVPFAGHVTNGFSYVINRDVWAYDMLVAFIVAKVFSNLSDFKRYRAYQAGTLFLLIGMLVFQGYRTYRPWGGNYTTEFLKKGVALKELEEAASSSLNKLEESEMWRYEQLQPLEPKNAAMQQGKYGTSFYFSIANGYVSQFQREMALNREREFLYTNLDGRYALESLANVKFCITRKEQENQLPYDFAKVKETTAYDYEEKENGTFIVGENQNTLSFGYTCDGYIPREKYEKMTVAERQQALLQGVVLENSEFPQTETEFDDADIEYGIKASKEVQVEENQIKVKKKNASLTLQFKGKENSETYVVFENLTFDKLSDKSKNKRRVSIMISSGEVQKKLIYFTPFNSFYSDIHDFAINMGYQNGAKSEITLEFKNKGIYKFDSLKVICQPMMNMVDDIAARNVDTLQEIEKKTNALKGKITLKKPKILVLSVPYSTGWTAYVDGEKTELKQADTMYMAIELTEGTHEVKIKYMTPYLKLGLFLSLIGIVDLTFCGKKGIIRRIGLKKKKMENEK